MKQVLIALAAVLAMGSAVAQPGHWRDRPADKIVKHVTFDHGVKYVVIETQRCTDVGRRGYCRHWEVVDTQRRVVRRGYRH